MSLLVLVLLCVSLVHAHAYKSNGNSTIVLKEGEYTTVDKLDIIAYSGLWYQMYDNKKAQVYEPNGMRCITAVYGATDSPNAVSVHNYGIYQGKDDDEWKVSTIDGQATSVDTEEPGQLVLRLNGVPVPADYWIYELGPLNADGLYDYAIVSAGAIPDDALYVLARDVDTFRSAYEDDVLATVADMGFSNLRSKPIETYQEEDCTYE